MTIPRGILNNNPGNIRKSAADWVGKIYSDDPDFESFDTPENGIRALAKLIVAYQDKHGCKTIRRLIERWAPPGENNTDAYVDDVAASMGVGPDDIVIANDPTVLLKIVVAIIQHENGQQPYSLVTVNAGVESALS